MQFQAPACLLFYFLFFALNEQTANDRKGCAPGEYLQSKHLDDLVGHMIKK